uniref:Pentatricopeptide repeat-containing protein At2g01390 n=2 Tax=Anthurium amnicola TaxID=1678845 RepID=A0A1D1XMN0_9ARAE
MNKMQEAGVQPDKAMCNILIQKCSKFGEITTMFQVLQYMKQHSLVLRLQIFLVALETLRNSGKSDHLLREVNPHFSSVGMEQETSDSEHAVYDINTCIDRGIVINLLARQNFVAIDHILRGMILQNMKLDAELISAVIEVSCRNERLPIALLAFQYSVRLGQKHGRHTYLALIGPLIRLSCFQEVLKIVEEMIKEGQRLGTYLVSLLVLRLGCAGMSAVAAKLFYSLPGDQNAVTYTALIHAYLQSAEIDKGLEVYASMRKGGIRASSGTYEVLIVGLNEAGRSHEAEFFKKEKKRWQFYESSLQSLSLEETLCDCFFNGG